MLLNGTWAVQKSYTKPYASCRYTHPAVEAAIGFRRDGVRPEDVKKITVRTYSLAVRGHDHQEIPGSYSAKMSIPYSVAAGLMFGKAGLDEFSEEQVRAEDILALTGKVFEEADEAFSQAFPATQTALVEVETTEGGRLQKQVDFPKGEPENPLSEEEFRERYEALMAFGGVRKDEYHRIYRAVSEEVTTVCSLLN